MASEAHKGGPRTVGNIGSIAELASAIRQRELSPVDLVQRCLTRIADVDGQVQSWVEANGERALAIASKRADEAAAGHIRGPLHGIPIAVKDNIDVEGFATLCNSRTRVGSASAQGDAEIVLALKCQGAIVLGKVHTTEFAFFDPSPARNPWNLEHTPGGSSSGSAAAVAAGMVPLALGTQTVASVNRPAAYCGISAFKPSTRSLSSWGIAPLAPSYDTTGFMAATVDDAVYAYEAAMPPFANGGLPPEVKRELTITVPVDALTDDCDSEIAAAVQHAGDALASAGHSVSRVATQVSFVRLFQLQRKTTLYEAARALVHLKNFPENDVGIKLREALAEGRAIVDSDYFDARSEIDAMRLAFWKSMRNSDLCLWPAAPKTAPKGLASTGDPKYIAPWTALGGPVVTVPLAISSAGLPIGALIASAPGSDRRMCDMARQAARVLGN